ncbi:hypothetical protein [Nocardiopsis suaedae]|uniref:DUF317 domain-containing protein n=1 Tax=Nocardiopsis suaedae TaxID=3018444 RepID=A0ABT4TJR1_9ACTN|nr:hypothetical protein [Nocardiopsis suaedae]MDA2804856.1 hypothetical protein [Nocardiopsis suaedae]
MDAYGHPWTEIAAREIAARLSTDTSVYTRTLSPGPPVWCVRAGATPSTAVVVALAPDARSVPTLAWVWDDPADRGPIAPADLTFTRVPSTDPDTAAAMLAPVIASQPPAGPTGAPADAA